MLVLDISDPASPTEISAVDTPGYARRVTLHQGHAYVAGGAGGVYIVDVLDPGNPILVETVNTGGEAFDVAVTNGHAFVANEREGLKVFELLPGPHLVPTGSIQFGSWMTSVTVVGNVAYLAGNSSSQVVDVSDPSEPVRLGFYGFSTRMILRNQYGYVAAGDTRNSYFFHVADVTNPSLPDFVGSTDLYHTESRDVAISGSHAYLPFVHLDLEHTGLQILDIQDPVNPLWVAELRTHDARGIDIAGGYAYVADGDRGLLVFDLANPIDPQLVAVYPGGNAHGVVTEGGFAYLADGASGLRIIDVSDMGNATEVAWIDTPGYCYDVAIAGTNAFVADGTAGVQVLNISDPTQPQLIASFPTTDATYDICILGALAYTASGTSGFHIVDIADPTNLTTISTVPPIAPHLPGSQIAVRDSLAYAVTSAGGAGWLEVIDVSNPVSPRVVGSTQGTSLALYGGDDLALHGPHAYVADGRGLAVIDISDPTDPHRIDWTFNPWPPWPWITRGLALDPPYAYLGDTEQGLQVIDIRDPANPFVAGVYPGVFAQGAWIDSGRLYAAAGLDGLIVLPTGLPLKLDIRPWELSPQLPLLELTGRVGSTVRIERGSPTTGWDEWFTLILPSETLDLLDPNPSTQMFYRATADAP